MTPAPGGSLALFLLASLAVAGLTYAASRFVGNWQHLQTRGRRLRILEAVPMGKDRNLMLVVVGKELLVVGSSPTGIALVHQVTDPTAVAEMLEQQPEAAPSAGLPAQLAPVGQMAENAVRESVTRMRALLGRLGDRADG